MNGRLILLISAWVSVALAEPQAPPLTKIDAGPGLRVRVAADHEHNGITFPSAIAFDEKNALYVTERGQARGGEPDLVWYADDLAARTVADRLALADKWKDRAPAFAGGGEIVRRLLDGNGDGVMDSSNVYAEGFDGRLSGVMAWGDTVYLAAAPKLLGLSDSTGNGVADKRARVEEGFGVHIVSAGHDMCGLVLGPDGRIYGCIGDSGLDVKTRGGQEIHMPDEGCVFRFEPDGTGFEVVHRGLHDPAGLAFDDMGNLIALDRGAGMGDKARLICVVDGGDSGWEIGQQSLAEHFRQIGMQDMPPVRWLAERIWETANDTQPAWMMPPAGYCAEEPSGLAAYPGTGFVESAAGRFFLCDHRRKPDDSGVWSFGVTQDGAGLKMSEMRREIGGVEGSDVAFGWDGRLYMAESGERAAQHDGRILVADAEKPWRAAEAADAARLAREGFEQRAPEELARLLCHADRRVRMRAEFALARQPDAVKFLEEAAKGGDRFGRLHGVWGLGILARRGAAVMPQVDSEFQILPGGKQQELAAKSLRALAKDADEELRVQIIRCLGESNLRGNMLPLATWLSDASPRVKYAAAITAGKLKSVGNLESIWAMLEKNDNHDAYLRHAGVFALGKICEPRQLTALAGYPSAAVRLAAVAALARKRDPMVAVFLHDRDERVALDALRAIHDFGIDDARPQVAQLLDQDAGEKAFAGRSVFIQRRILHSAYQLGGEENARRLARVAADMSVPGANRLEASRLLAQWTQPFPVDQSTGHWHPLSARPAPGR